MPPVLPTAIDDALVQRLYKQGNGARWGLPVDAFRAALDAGVRRAFPESGAPRDVERFLSSLHLEDLTLACACNEGIDSAWEHFVSEVRPPMLRAADALDKTGGARELADSLYGDLFGLREGEERRSLFRYYHGRSSLATWLRAVLAQRYVDRLRRDKKSESLPDDESPKALSAPRREADPHQERYSRLLKESLARAVAGLDERDRIRLRCYYAQEMTLAAIGRVTGEHEATVSRHLSRTRRTLRETVERDLEQREGLSAEAIAACFSSNLKDPADLDLNVVLGDVRKESVPERSI